MPDKEGMKKEVDQLRVGEEKDVTLGVRSFSFAISGFGQVLKSDPREKPLDQSAIPLIAPSQLQPRLYQKHPESGCFAYWFLEISNVSNSLIGLQSE